MINNDITESVRTAILSQFAKGELKLPIPLETIQPAPDLLHAKGRFWRWMSEGRRARTEAALLAQHGQFLMAYAQELHNEVVPANGKAVHEICNAAVDVVHNQQLRRRAASAFQVVAGILHDYNDAKAEIEATRAEAGDEATQVALAAADDRFQQCLSQINPNGAFSDRPKKRVLPTTLGGEQ